MNTTSLDDLLAAQTAAENLYYQAGSPRSGPIFDAYTAALNAVDRLQTQIENTNYNTPGVQYTPSPTIVDPETGRIIGSVPQPGGLTAVPISSVDTAPAPVNTAIDPVAQFRRVSDEELVVRTQDVPVSDTAGYGGPEDELAVPESNIRTFANPGDEDAQQVAFQTFAAPGDEDAQQVPFSQAGGVNSQVIQAQNQQTNRALAQFPVNTDWRVVLRLAPGANYLYAAPDAGLLQPLKTTNGVVFPYTPSITTAYKANYSEYNLTHSNYRGYFYQNSYTDTVQLNATFTAQSTADAAYVLAVIHFFRSVTKMFYGNDAQRGSPPPLVYLSGLGDYQFNNHPCLVSQFNYVLPPDVDYISSGSPNNLGLNLQPLQNLYSTTLNAVAPTVTRLATAFLPRGAENERPAPLQALLSNPTYVPSKIDIQLSLFPVQSRSAVSKQFSLKNFANGNLLKGGFW